MRRLVAIAALGVLLASTGCGGRNGATLVVSAAASLQRAFTAYGDSLAPERVRYSFAGSNELAAQIRQGVRPDVFASANLKLPEDLHRAGLAGQPRVFATNRLVLAVPASGARVRSLADAARAGVTIATGSATVPVGSYTRTVLARLGPLGTAITRNVRSQEPDVKGVVGKLLQGAIDAGFVYVTDVHAAKGGLRAIELPARASPVVAYAAVVVAGAPHRVAAQRFVDGLLAAPGLHALLGAGFGRPPAR